MQFSFFIRLLFDNQFSFIILTRIILSINLRKILNKKFVLLYSFHIIISMKNFLSKWMMLLFYFQKKKNIENI